MLHNDRIHHLLSLEMVWFFMGRAWHEQWNDGTLDSITMEMNNEIKNKDGNEDELK